MTETSTSSGAEPASPRRHLLIAGTGRAGTSFLVKYLTALGLDTSFGRYGEAGAGWSSSANAGLEQMLLVQPDQDLPYVLKSPWAGEYIEEILGSKRFAIDALVVPIRDLVEAATSRAVAEYRSIHQTQPWVADKLDRTWEVAGVTPGGLVFSLNPLDQARLLAVSFHRLVHRAAEAQIPLVFPVFPRMVEDWEYLYHTLKPILPIDVSAQTAREAHATVASLAKVRIGDEVATQKGLSAADTAIPQPQIRYPSPVEVDNIALRRELRSVREEKLTADAALERARINQEKLVADAAIQNAGINEEKLAADAALDRARVNAEALSAAVAAHAAERAGLNAEIDRLRRQVIAMSLRRRLRRLVGLK